MQFLEQLTDDRNSLPEGSHPPLQSINITIIINCCMVLEGFLFTIIKDYLKITEGEIKSNPKLEAIINPSLFSKILTEYSTKLDEGS